MLFFDMLQRGALKVLGFDLEDSDFVSISLLSEIGARMPQLSSAQLRSGLVRGAGAGAA